MLAQNFLRQKTVFQLSCKVCKMSLSTLLHWHDDMIFGRVLANLKYLNSCMKHIIFFGDLLSAELQHGCTYCCYTHCEKVNHIRPCFFHLNVFRTNRNFKKAQVMFPNLRCTIENGPTMLINLTCKCIAERLLVQDLYGKR